MNTLVLDSWAVLAWLKREKPAAGHTRALLQSAGQGGCRLYINIVNWGEIFYLCVKARNPAYARRVLQTLRPRLTVIPASDDLVMAAATLKARYPISYADGFAIATALDVPLVTGDPEIRALAASEKKLKLEWIGR